MAFLYCGIQALRRLSCESVRQRVRDGSVDYIVIDRNVTLATVTPS